MEFAVQRCCTTPVFLQQYNASTDVVLKKLGAEILDIKEFNCCGYPLKNINLKAHLLASGRNMSLAESRGLDIITFCNCCYGSLKNAAKIMGEDESVLSDVNETLGKEELSYDGNVSIKHFMEVLYKDIGIKEINSKIHRPFKGLKVAVHYGCHVLRPSSLVRFDPPGTAAIFNQLIEITGAEIVDWPMQKECCGSPMWGVDDDLSMDLASKKLSDAKRAEADYLVTACPYCHLQFDRIQKLFSDKMEIKENLPPILFTQLLGLTLGIDEEMLGMENNEMNINGIMEFLN